MDSCDLANILLCETNHTIFVNKDENSKLTRSYQKSIQHKWKISTTIHDKKAHITNCFEVLHSLIFFFLIFFLRLVKWSSGSGEGTNKSVTGCDQLIVNTTALGPVYTA